MAALPDPLLLNILAQLDPKPLCRFLQASKATYVLGHFAELWRQLVLTTTDAVTAGKRRPKQRQLTSNRIHPLAPLHLHLSFSISRPWIIKLPMMLRPSSC